MENQVKDMLAGKVQLTMEEKKQVCRMLMTSESRMENLIIQYFNIEDFRTVAEHMIGSGQIGGKACGLLTARKILELRYPKGMEKMEPLNAFYVGSDVFEDYLTFNECDDLCEKKKLEGEAFTEYEELKCRMLAGTFQPMIEEQLEKIIDNFEGAPLIVRSSSFMEDGYGNAFSGKYESIFCTSQGSKAERMQELMEAIRGVYASTVNPSAIEYRKKRKLLNLDEEMALLIQKVSGRQHGDYFFPVAAGMGCSFNPYKWMDQLNPDAGMARMVMGLGTRAVERTPGDYPRLIGLERPEANLRTTIAERHKYSQRNVDVLNLAQQKIETKPLRELLPLLSHREQKLVLSRDTEAESRLAQRRDYRKVYFADCQGIAQTKAFTDMLGNMMRILEQEYERPVDMEFAISACEDQEFHFELLQCRPLQKADSEKIHIPEEKREQMLFDVRRTSMRRSKTERLDYIVRVNPKTYYECDYLEKPRTANTIGELNQLFEKMDCKAMLLVPGRIGTSSPELGVPVIYADISQFIAICEVAYDKAGYHPELSYGSHMFQDMVEADVYYGAINDNNNTKVYEPGRLLQFPNVFSTLCPDSDLTEMIEVYDVRAENVQLLLSMEEGRAVCVL